MGLAERRALKEFQDSSFPELQTKILEAAGFDIELEIDWPTLAEDGMSHMYSENLPKVYFEPLIEALGQITADEMGKEALQESIGKIVICNRGGISSGGRVASVEGKILTVDHKPNTNVDYGAERVKGLVATLEAEL
jgi:hypothetical protein